MNSKSTKLPKIIALKIAQEEMVFDYRRALYWIEKNSLIISDLHIGKAGHFRKNGIALSKASSFEDLKRLEALIEEYKPQTVLILGDLSHSSKNNEWQDWINFRNKFIDLSFVLVPGNHDILGLKDYNEANVQLTDNIYQQKPFSFTHDPIDSNSSLFNISGHIHPGVRLSGAARQSLTLPCFYISSRQIILPAFSSLSGKYKIKPKKDDKFLALTSKGILLINT